MEANQKRNTLVLVCHRSFCRLLDRMLREENIGEYQHGDLSLLAGAMGDKGEDDVSEVYIVRTDKLRAERIISLLRACPLRPKRGRLFELYMVGEMGG